MTRSIRAHFVALLAALVLVLPGSAWARAYYQCRATGQAMNAPCCDEGKRSSQPQAPEARPLDCCQRIAPVARAGALGTELTQLDIAPAALLPAELTPLAPAALEQTLRATPIQARAPPAQRRLPQARAPPQ